MKNLPPRILYLIVTALLAFAVSSCSTFGIATEEYVEDRVKAVNEHTASAAERAVEPLEPLAPGLTEYVGETFRNEPTRPPPPPTPTDWGTVLVNVALALGLGVPLSVKATNVVRDMKRRQYGEATSVKEAIALGQLPVPVLKTPEAA